MTYEAAGRFKSSEWFGLSCKYVGGIEYALGLESLFSGGHLNFISQSRLVLCCICGAHFKHLNVSQNNYYHYYK